MIDCRAIVAHTTLAFRRDNAFVADVEEPWSRVAYVDETFNAGAYSICAVPIQVENVMSTKGELQSVVERWGEEVPLAETAELHGSDLWHGSGAFTGIAPRIRRAIYDDARPSF